MIDMREERLGSNDKTVCFGCRQEVFLLCARGKQFPEVGVVNEIHGLILHLQRDGIRQSTTICCAGAGLSQNKYRIDDTRDELLALMAHSFSTNALCSAKNKIFDASGCRTFLRDIPRTWVAVPCYPDTIYSGLFL